MSSFDVAVIGGGPAGLSASLVLARARWKVVVFDAGVPRNVASPAVQGFLSRDGTPPAELKRQAREQIDKYGTVEFRAARVTAGKPARLKLSAESVGALAVISVQVQDKDGNDCPLAANPVTFHEIGRAHV